MRKLCSQRSGLVVLMVIVLVSISTATRLFLLGKSVAAGLDFTVSNLLGILLLGWFYDLANAAYFSIPIVLYLWLVPERLFRKIWHRYVLYFIYFAFTFLLIFDAVAEWFFWDEFNTRFNFIAVDYLVYTTEVVGNIYQSYPMGWIILGISLASFAILYWIRPWIEATCLNPVVFKQRTKLAALYTLFPLGAFFFVSSKLHHFSDNAYANELSGNGMYELFSAYRNNELDFDQFYQQPTGENSVAALHQLIRTPETTFIHPDQQSIERKIANPRVEQKLNVVLITVESLSADFLGKFGNTDHLTPFLDSLADHSLLFTNLYATGTRTVRGLEATSICIPPLPGQSIVRRPENENLFSLATVFNSKGYESKFIYGGYGYFDNMNYYFENNGYDVVDRSALDDSEIDYENIWGVADENLFELAIREIDRSTADQPVFAHIMTTSNHRPYTYPDGRIDIPSHTGRSGSVKYTDYAIGQFIKHAATKKWFDQTVFVILADHCASSAGKTELPVGKYHIPMLIYAPSHVEPGVMDRLMSQIDVGPTVLGLLNFSYTSKFFGYDMFKLEAGRERAFISTYQNLGYIKGKSLVILSPQKKVETFVLDDKLEPTASPIDPTLVQEAAVYYQSASHFFRNGLMK